MSRRTRFTIAALLAALTAGQPTGANGQSSGTPTAPNADELAHSLGVPADRVEATILQGDSGGEWLTIRVGDDQFAIAPRSGDGQWLPDLPGDGAAWWAVTRPPQAVALQLGDEAWLWRDEGVRGIVRAAPWSEPTLENVMVNDDESDDRSSSFTADFWSGEGAERVVVTANGFEAFGAEGERLFSYLFAREAIDEVDLVGVHRSVAGAHFDLDLSWHDDGEGVDHDWSARQSLRWQPSPSTLELISSSEVRHDTSDRSGRYWDRFEIDFDAGATAPSEGEPCSFRETTTPIVYDESEGIMAPELEATIAADPERHVLLDDRSQTVTRRRIDLPAGFLEYSRLEGSLTLTWFDGGTRCGGEVNGTLLSIRWTLTTGEGDTHSLFVNQTSEGVHRASVWPEL